MTRIPNNPNEFESQKVDNEDPLFEQALKHEEEALRVAQDAILAEFNRYDISDDVCLEKLKTLRWATRDNAHDRVKMLKQDSRTS